MDKNFLLVGDTREVKEIAAALTPSGSRITIVSDTKAALPEAQALLPDVIAFVMPTYWESLLPFLKAIKADPHLQSKPIVYIGSDVIESAVSTMLNREGVHIITLGPVPTNEIARYLLSL